MAFQSRFMGESLDPPWAYSNASRQQSLFGGPVFPQELNPQKQKSFDRRRRLERIQPYWTLVENEQIPTIPREQLLELMKDFKDEGNMLFQENSFKLSCTLYTHSLTIAQMLDTHHFQRVDSMTLATLYANRSACHLKLDNNQNAFQDADTAYKLSHHHQDDLNSKTTIKALYRKAHALKGLGKYQEALAVAREGSLLDERNFRGLQEELEQIIRNSRMSDYWSRSQQSAPPKSATVTSIHSNLSRPATASATYARPAPRMNDVDPDWLSGTNVRVTEKAKIERKAKKSPKKKANASSKSVSLVSTYNIYDGLEDTSESDNADSDMTDTDESYEEEHQDPLVKNVAGFHSVAPKPSMPEKVMGLDQFGFKIAQANHKAKKTASAPTTNVTSPMQNNRQPAQNRKNQKQPEVEMNGITQNKSSPGSFAGNLAAATAASAMTGQNYLPAPHSKYQYVMACSVCFKKIGDGYDGYQYKAGPHKCTKDYVLIRPTETLGNRWLKIRPRPAMKKNYTGKFRLCQQYQEGRACQIGELKCTFCHSFEEMEFWERDRDGTWNVHDFIEKQKSSGSQRPKQPQPVVETKVFSASRSSPKQTQKKPAIKKPLLPTPAQPNANSMQPHPLYHSPPAAPTRPTHQAPAQNYPVGMPAPAQPAAQNTRHAFTRGQVQPVYSTIEPVDQTPFPLKTHEWLIACFNCLRDTGIHSCLIHSPSENHKCDENVLVVKRKGDPYYRWVRERRGNHRMFAGKYKLCIHYTNATPRQCRVPVDLCLFAHNLDEQALWTLDKDGKFNITEFILQNRSIAKRKGYSLELLSNHGGALKFLCMACFFNTPCRLSTQRRDTGYCQVGRHPWRDNKMMVHITIDGNIIPIGVRPFKHKTAFFKMCPKLQYCPGRFGYGCPFAHSLVERDIWMVERDMECSQDEIVEVLEKERFPVQQQIVPPPTPPPSVTPSSAAPPRSAPSPCPSASSSTSETVVERTPKGPQCPFRLIFVCELCWNQGQKVSKDDKRDKCAGPGPGHDWERNKIGFRLPQNKVVRRLPPNAEKVSRFVICEYFQQKKQCKHYQCRYAHTDEEKEVWQWMVANKIMTLDELVDISARTHASVSAAKPKITQGTSVVAAAKASQASQARTQSHLNQAYIPNAYYCKYCSKSCNGQKQWDEHCSSERHLFNVNSDKEHQWNYRQPPWGVVHGNYKLCSKHATGGRCYYSNVDDMHNSCTFAHSQEELDEWKERFQWRQMKIEMAKKERVFSYMDTLVDDYDSADSGVAVISEYIEGVEITAQDPLTVYKDNKAETITWEFNVVPKNGQKLERVAMLYNKDRLHFQLIDGDTRQPCQIAPGDCFQIEKAKGNPKYHVKVTFRAGMFGSFSQWVVFDFGSRPVAYRQISVEVGTKESQAKVQSLREKLQFDRWTSDNREIVRFDHVRNKAHVDLMKKYRPPSSAEAVITQESVVIDLNHHNYVHKMHKLLYIEEITRHQIISSYNLCATIELLNTISEEMYIYARPGELFARVPLNEELSEDTDAGKLILSSVQRVLIAPQKTPGQKVYEAIVVQKENFDYDGRGRDYIYLCLSPNCCQELELEANNTVNIEIQFQMNRLPFSLMHYAVDQLKDTDIVFPDVTKIRPELTEKHLLKLSSKVLNDDQMKIVRHIAAERTGYTPPLIIYGPFGTGKTETIAQATMVLCENLQHTRILICSQSNSAADLYIMKHFDDFHVRHPKIAIRRVYAGERRVNTVQAVVRRYCLLSEDHSRFIVPSCGDIQEHQIVITTLTQSLMLTRYPGLKDHFTHIFIDEAGQALECEAIMPLALANEQTCVVLAGDHMQMSPKVYSQESKKQCFHQSLLERLFHHYQNHSKMVKSVLPLQILLTRNYRSKLEIVRFLSAVFYGGPDKLVSESIQPTPENIVPLTFYTAQGREMQDADGTSYYNMAEVEEVTDCVEHLWLNWPPEWGDRRADVIGVVTPYYDQVSKIRNALRKRRRDLQEIVVERVNNVQGKEFRALFISTVRTRHLCESTPRAVMDTTGCDGDFGDYGFLSDKKLLNTALTRAQSMVAIVGDPVALCAIGDCMNVWRTFLKHCQNMKSIYPRTVSLDSVKASVIGLMMSQYGRNIVQINDGDIGSNDMPISADEVQTAVINASASSNTNGPVSGPVGMKNADPMKTAIGTVLDDLNLDYRIEPDDILKQLAKEVVRTNKKAERCRRLEEGLEGGEDDTDEKLKTEHITVKQQQGHAVLYYKNAIAPRRHLLGAEGYEFDPEDADDEKEDNEPVYADLTHQQLEDLLRQKDKYKKCIAHVEDSKHMYAEVLDRHENSGLKEIKLSSRQRCGRAFDNDVVVVEILEPSEDEQLLQLADPSTPPGQVVGILKPAINPLYRMFVCTVEPSNTGVMVPLNRGIPKIYNVASKNRLQQTKKGHVCVYMFTKDREVIFHRYEKIDKCNPTNKLFIVRYLKWDPQHYFPLGIVVGVLPQGDTIQTGMQILDIEHYIPKKFHKDALSEFEKCFPPGYTLPASALQGRQDLRNKLVFTIDPQNSLDINSAMSFEMTSKEEYVIGIHVADVSHFVQRDSPLDADALNRGTSLYPAGAEVIHMLPETMSTDLLSLKQHQDRLTLSIFLTVTQEGEIVKVDPQRCVIKSRFQLTYKQAEEILRVDSDAYPQELKTSIWSLYHFGQIWRRKRLGTAAMYQRLDEGVIETPYADQLVSEVLIMVNHQVAKYLRERFPTSTPLRRQLAPNELQLEEWRKTHAVEALNSVALRQPFIPSGWVCECDGVCACVSLSLEGDPLAGKFVDIKSDIWHEVCEAVERGEVDAARNLVIMPENHPQLCVAQRKLQQLQDASMYVCSDPRMEDEHWHYSLNLMPYTHFTSPIRRCIDIIVHRMIVGAIERRPTPYTPREVSDICAQMTSAARRSNRYQLAVESLHLGSALQKRPLVTLPVIDEVSDQSIHLAFPDHKGMNTVQTDVDMLQLNVAERPDLNRNQGKLIVKWEQRIYDLSHWLDELELREKNAAAAILNPNRFVIQIPADNWQEILEAVQANDAANLNYYFQQAKEKVRDLASDARFAKDVTSEMKDKQKIMQHHSEFKQTLQACHVVQVQLAMEVYKGLMVPRIQLFSLTPKFGVCIEHQTDTLRCFANSTIKRASCVNYKDIITYQKSWLPAMAIESASSAVNSGNNFLIHNVHIKWTPKDGEAFIGIFQFPLEFCKGRQLKLSGDLILGDRDMTYDFLCIRYSGVELDQDGQISLGAPSSESNETVTWVCHCHTIQVITVKEKGIVQVHAKYHQSSVKFPKQLLTGVAVEMPCTVEFIPKTVQSRRMEIAIRELPNANNLAKDIAVMRKPVPYSFSQATPVKELCKVESVPGLNPPNREQLKAIRSAIIQPFSLIQGPPGTGKTEMGAFLAFLFTLLNRQAGDLSGEKKAKKAQVLFCGPTNKSLDVVASFLKKVSGRSRLVRVYSESIEHQDFPLPAEPLPSRHKFKDVETAASPEHIDIALHHMIRQPNKPFASKLADFDQRFRANPEDASEMEVTEYLDLVATCEAEELKRADIVLCTCSASSSTRLRKIQEDGSCCFNQVIIDECSMCQEPESMIPIVTSRPSQVVLIGDSNQLHPNVASEQAKDLGLDVSLFERYADKASMLSFHYRMHKSIAAFPSKHIYNDRLQEGGPEQSQPSTLNIWPGPTGRNAPVAFCHVVGKEAMLTISTAEGNLQSYQNEMESMQAVRYARTLVTKYKVAPKNVVILCQYHAQCAEMERRLKESGQTGITVSTIIASQGSEWDFVIISTVRSLPRCEIEKRPTNGWIQRHLGFITDKNQINVGITRAKKGLVIVGNKYLLRCDKMWRALLDHYNAQQKVVDANLFMALR